MYWAPIPAALALWLVSGLVSLLNNIRRAKSIQIPIVVSPFGSHSPIWVVFQDALIPVFEKLPLRLGGFTRYSRRGWGFFDKYKMHQQHGKVFAHVTPTEIEVYVADPMVSDQVLDTRKRGFVKPTEMVGKDASWIQLFHSLKTDLIQS